MYERSPAQPNLLRNKKEKFQGYLYIPRRRQRFLVRVEVRGINPLMKGL